MYTKEHIRSLLSLNDQIIFDQIENHTLLGASNHIKAIGTMIENLANSDNTPEQIIHNIKLICNYYIQTRGKASQAISNAIFIMISNIDKINLNSSEFRINIINNKNNYFDISSKNLEKILFYATNESKKFKSILAYDYSSTVEKFLINLSKDNISRKLFIPESRIIDGGYPFIKKLYSIKNYDIHFIPDCSLFHFMKNVDACFMGAETLYADGTGFNTTGSDIVGLICNYYHIPLYFLTPMIKLDTRSIEGFHKELVIDNLYIKLTKNWDLDINKDNIQFKTPELVPVNPNFIYAYITEYGIIPANQMYNIALNYINNLQKDVTLNE